MIFHALGFPEISLLGLGFGQKTGWEMGFIRPPPPHPPSGPFIHAENAHN